MTRQPRSWEWVAQTDDYNVYKDVDGRVWHVPTYPEICPICNGDGEIEDWINDEMDICWNCEGDGEVVIQHYDDALTDEERRGYELQLLYLEKRYGCAVPSRISDYWLRPGSNS